MYTIITAPTLQELESRVRSCLAKGFILAGGITTVTHSYTRIPYYVQPEFRHRPNGYDNLVSFAQAVYKPAAKTLT